jgi:hypothetical protein
MKDNYAIYSTVHGKIHVPFASDNRPSAHKIALVHLHAQTKIKTDIHRQELGDNPREGRRTRNSWTTSPKPRDVDSGLEG